MSACMLPVYIRTAGEDKPAPDCTEDVRDRFVIFGLNVYA